MTWFLRKAFRFGPLRLNLSKRGLGASIGVKGARIGVDAEGKPYVFGGRRGFYFRQRLGASTGARHHQDPPAPSAPSLLPPEELPAPRRRGWGLVVLLVILALLVGLVVGAILAHGGK